MRRKPSKAKKSRNGEVVLEIDLPVELIDRLMHFCDRTGFDVHTVITIALECGMAADEPAGLPPKEPLQ